MHCLTGTYLVNPENASSENGSDPPLATSSKISNNSDEDAQASVTASSAKENEGYHSLKIVIPPNKSRMIFFKQAEDKELWRGRL